MSLNHPIILNEGKGDQSNVSWNALSPNAEEDG